MQNKPKPSFYTGQVIYVKSHNDVIKQLIRGERGLFDSSHKKIYGTPVKTPFVNEREVLPSQPS